MALCFGTSCFVLVPLWLALVPNTFHVKSSDVSLEREIIRICFLSIQIYFLKAREIQKVAFTSFLGSSHHSNEHSNFMLSGEIKGGTANLCLIRVLSQAIC